MENRIYPQELTHTSTAARTYELPTIVLIGDACDVTFGLPGGGYDGPYGMTDPRFEFEQDGQRNDR